MKRKQKKLKIKQKRLEQKANREKNGKGRLGG